MEELVQSRRPVNILLVDDQPAKLVTYETILADMGENLIKANSGREALDCLLRSEIAVVLVDACMPEMDGFELTSMIRNHPRFQRTAVILVSGLFTEDVDRLKGYVSGAVDYVSVPIIPEILRAKVSVFADLFRKTEALEELNRQKLRESEERFRTMADTAPVMIWVSGPERQGLFFNRPWLEFTGGTLEEEQNAGWMAGVHPEDVGRTSTIYSSAFEARRSFQMEFRLRRADGEYRWVVCNGAPRFAPDGVFGGYVASSMDVSDVKRAQEEVLAGQKLESLGVLASGVAHDFNNMIGGIMANAELALSQSSAEESNKYVQDIVSMATQGGEI